MPGWPQLRDMILFFGGLGGVAHETFLASTDRPELLIVFAAMMGLPAFLQADQRISRRDDNPSTPSTSTTKGRKRP